MPHITFKRIFSPCQCPIWSCERSRKPSLGNTVPRKYFLAHNPLQVGQTLYFRSPCTRSKRREPVARLELIIQSRDSPILPRGRKLDGSWFVERTRHFFLRSNCFTTTVEGYPIAYAHTLDNDLEIVSREKRAAGRPSVLQRPAAAAPRFCCRCLDWSLRDDGCVRVEGCFKGCSWTDYQACCCCQGRYSIPASAWFDRRS